jgi:hypothetical protein
MKPSKNQKVCFVIMGFGKKTDFETGRVLDLDKSYLNIIKPAVEDAGLTCMRADEIIHSGVIDLPMYEQLLNADLVVADLSTSNKNALYELGIRHALKPSGTIVIAEEGLRTFPFDVNMMVVRQYRHLGEDIGYEEIMRFRQNLTEAIKVLIADQEKQPQIDSPVYAFLRNLQPPSMSAGTAPTGDSNKSDSKGSKVVEPAPEPVKDTLAIIKEQGAQALKEYRFTDAIVYFQKALELDPKDPTLIQQHVLATYQAGVPDLITALFTARDLLAPLSPEESTDRKTIELLGDIEVRLFQAEQGVNHLFKARHLYERLHKIKGDWQSAITLAKLVSLQIEYKKDRLEKLADIFFADQLRRENIQFGKERLAVINELNRMEDVLPKALKTEDRAEEQMTIWFTMALAYHGLDDSEGYFEARDMVARSKNGRNLITALDKEIARSAPALAQRLKLKNQIENIGTRTFDETQAVSDSRRDARKSHAEVNVSQVEVIEVAPQQTTTATDIGREVFISYSWSDESAAMADRLDKAFQAKGVLIVRDKRDLGFKGRIKHFMERIGRGRCVILIISDQYLRSENCLFELLQVAKAGEFFERVFPIVLGNARIYKPVDRIAYVQHWEKQLEELDSAMKTVSSVNLQGFREEIDLYAEIRASLPRLSDILKDMNTLTPQIHRDSDFEQLFDSVMGKLAE